jgi:nitrate reductase cytochrome c-type subunit
MTDLYKKRFAELQQQMEDLFASQKPIYSHLLERNEINIDGNSLLEWTVKTRSLLSKACGIESEHYKEFCENDKTGLYGTYIATLESLRAIFLAARGLS